MEKVQQQLQLWRAVKSRLTYKNATILVCSFNIISALLLLQLFFFSTSQKALYRHIKESEDIRRAMVPLDLIRRVREIEQDLNVRKELIQQKDVKQTAAVDLISRLNNFRSYSDTGSIKADDSIELRKLFLAFALVHLAVVWLEKIHQFMGMEKSEKHVVVSQKMKGNKEEDMRKSLFNSSAKSQANNGRPSSLVIKKVHGVIPAHIVAEAISTLHGLDLRWSGPITPTEMQYVEQYVLAKYPEYSKALVEGGEKTDLYDLCIKEKLSEPQPDDKRRSPRGVSVTPSFGSSLPDLENTQLEPSRLLSILTKKSSFLGSFISIPEIQARNKVLKHWGLPDEEYLVLFTQNYRDAMMLVGESYPFFKGNYYLTIIREEEDYVREFASYKESRAILAPESWLDLRIKGSQLSHYFRRKCKHTPKGLFSYPVEVNGTRYSLHWISEAHRNSWHVLVDATALVMGEDQLNLALYRPDFVLCTIDNAHAHSSKVTCLLVRRKSFDMSASSTAPQE